MDKNPNIEDFKKYYSESQTSEGDTCECFNCTKRREAELHFAEETFKKFIDDLYPLKNDDLYGIITKINNYMLQHVRDSNSNNNPLSLLERLFGINDDEN